MALITDPVSAVSSVISDIIERVIPDPAAKVQAQLELLKLHQSGELAQINDAAGIIKQEAASEYWLTATWRPITALTFTALIVARWFGWSAPNLHESEYASLWNIVNIMIGGYTIGRSVEKLAPSITGAITGKG
jgi:hypothetical protein